MLVLPANIKRTDLLEIYDHYSILGINNLIFKIIEPKNSQIVYYKKFQYTKKITNNKTNWYESALITTIVGGLAYLFYFGTN